MAKNKTTKRRISLSHALFLISGITLIIYYLIKKGVPSIGNTVVSVMNFIVDVFVIFLLFFFYFFILFKTRDNLSTTTAIAPSLLILIIVGHYSMNFGNQIANSVITSIAEMFYLLILVCGVVMLFIPEKLLGMIFSFSCCLFRHGILHRRSHHQSCQQRSLLVGKNVRNHALYRFPCSSFRRSLLQQQEQGLVNLRHLKVPFFI